MSIHKQSSAQPDRTKALSNSEFALTGKLPLLTNGIVCKTRVKLLFGLHQELTTANILGVNVMKSYQ